MLLLRKGKWRFKTVVFQRGPMRVGQTIKSQGQGAAVAQEKQSGAAAQLQAAVAACAFLCHRLSSKHLSVVCCPLVRSCLSRSFSGSRLARCLGLFLLGALSCQRGKAHIHAAPIGVRSVQQREEVAHVGQHTAGLAGAEPGLPRHVLPQEAQRLARLAPRRRQQLLPALLHRAGLARQSAQLARLAARPRQLLLSPHHGNAGAQTRQLQGASGQGRGPRAAGWPGRACSCRLPGAWACKPAGAAGQARRDRWARGKGAGAAVGRTCLRLQLCKGPVGSIGHGAALATRLAQRQRLRGSGGGSAPVVQGGSASAGSPELHAQAAGKQPARDAAMAFNVPGTQARLRLRQAEAAGRLTPGELSSMSAAR